MIIAIGLIIFIGHYLRGVFDRKSIPDVLGLMLLGFIIGPVCQLVSPDSFGKFGALFSNLVLVLILFESGIDLKLDEVKSSLKSSSGITIMGFFVTWLVLSVFVKLVFNSDWLTCLYIGATMGGTSSVVVAGLVKKINILPKTSATLIMESAQTDLFTLAIPISILKLMTTGEIRPEIVISGFFASLILALFIGIAGGILWLFILNKIPSMKSTKFSTLAFLFILYGVCEYLNYSGPLTVLTFGIILGNAKSIKLNFLKSNNQMQSAVLSKSEIDFLNELVFLFRTFFFIWIGMNIKVERLDWFLMGGVATAVLYLARILLIRIIADKKNPVVDNAAISIMIPKGLGAAVIATLPAQAGLADGAFIQSFCYSVIFFSTLLCVLFFFLIKSRISMPIYNLIFSNKYNRQPS